mmetsp:Transcript_9996/g.20262  ORF Transcript_9996/g.20262 Transcript_9996/m.20262 type:complete len:87 (+) Transcript_9996:63-323(+)
MLSCLAMFYSVLPPVLILLFLTTLEFISASTSTDFLRCMRAKGLASTVIVPGTSSYTLAIQNSWVSDAGWTPVAFVEATSQEFAKH